MILCLACAGSPQPTTMRLLSSLPVDRERAHEHMDSSTARPDAETRRPLPPKVRKVETVAATAAALVGSFFSTSDNAIVGMGGSMEETKIVPETRATVTHGVERDAPPAYRASDLVPWLRVAPPSPVK